MERITLSIQSAQKEALDALRDRSHEVDGMAPMSRSEVGRRLVDVGLDEADDLMDLLTETDRKRLQYEALKDENWLLNMREGFKSRAVRELQTRFEAGWTAEGIRAYADRKKAEAALFFDRDGDAERREQLAEWLDAMAAEAAEAAEVAEYDPTDPDEAFAYGGVEQGRENAAMPALVAEARTELDRRPGLSLDALADRLTAEYDVADETAREAVETARDRILDDRDDRAEGPTYGGGEA